MVSKSKKVKKSNKKIRSHNSCPLVTSIQKIYLSKVASSIIRKTRSQVSNKFKILALKFNPWHNKKLELTSMRLPTSLNKKNKLNYRQPLKLKKKAKKKNRQQPKLKKVVRKRRQQHQLKPKKVVTKKKQLIHQAIQLVPQHRMVTITVQDMVD